MSKYSIVLTKTAAKQLDALSDVIATPIINTIAKLADEPRPVGCKKLNGRDGYRIRQGDYRIIYDIFDKQLVVDVIKIAHRKDVYQ